MCRCAGGSGDGDDGGGAGAAGAGAESEGSVRKRIAVALSADKMGRAEKFVGEAARLAPGHPDVLYVQGVLYLKQGKWDARRAC